MGNEEKMLMSNEICFQCLKHDFDKVSLIWLDEVNMLNMCQCALFGLLIDKMMNNER